MGDKFERSYCYFGEKVNEKRNGHGIYIYENKFFKYEGQWRNGLKHGQGKLYMSDGSYYSGQFSNGEIDGQGYRYFGHTKSEYNGDFRKGEMHGRGRMVYSTGDIYEGQWYRNRKHGYGVMRTAGPETCGPETYEGGYNGDLRDGYGLMLYGNGDQYEGYWKNDIRVGRGVLKFADGSTYDGEFLKDMFHGQGLLRHSSGIVYNGEWINGYPRHISTKLVIVIEETDKKKVKKDKTEEEKVKTKKIIHQGVPFTIKVECRNEKDELIEDEGRELRLSAGFRHYPTVKSDDSALFDMIEDMEEKPIETPFGYSVVPYPITDQLHVNVEELDDLETDNDDLERSQTDFQNEESPQESDEKENNVDENDRNENETINEEQTTPSIPLPPPVPNQRTTHGVCMWNELQLPPAPPGYRPFKAKEQFERDSNSKRSKSKVDRFRHNKKKSLEEKFAKTGEYVLMVHDVTNPPYLDKKLTPAFLLLKLKPPEIEKRKDNKAK